MSPRPAPDERRRLRRFVAAHVAAVGLLYALALAAGGGLAPPPFPPDERVALQSLTPPPAGRPGQLDVAPEAVSGRRAASLPDRHDIDPPWTVDGQGRVELKDR